MRNMRFALLALLSAVLFLGNLNIASATDEASCKKSGAIKVVEGVKYTCTKSGKKFYWLNGKKKLPAKSLPSQTSTNSPTSQNPQNLTLQATLQPDSTLRLELLEDVYLGHCISFLVYDWGVADSYEGVFYRQKKEFLIPVNIENADELPRSFTFECKDSPVQSFAFNWALAGQSSSVSVKRLTSAVIANKIINRLPLSSATLVPGYISVYLPEIERTRETYSVLEDGRNAHETSLTYRSSIPKDICSAKILNRNGEQLKVEKLGPNYFDSSNGLARSGFDRIHSWGYLTFKGYKEENLKLEVNCSGSGLSTVEFLHPAPLIPLFAREEGPCPAEYEGTVSSDLKSPNISLTCTKNVAGNFMWVNGKPKISTPLPTPTTGGKGPLEPAIEAQIKSIMSMGMKAKKIGANLEILRTKLSSKNMDIKNLRKIEDLKIKADNIYTLSKTASNVSNSQEATALAKQVVKGFNSVEEEFGKLVEVIG